MSAMRTAVEHIMGTAISLAAPDSVDAAVFRAAADDTFAYLRHVDEVFSPYRADSPVGLIRDARLDPHDLGCHPDGGEIYEVLELCAALHRASGGAFDAWAVGEPPRFDPSGAVKGWAGERASALLAAHGLPRHALNAGGDVRLRSDSETDAAPWRVGLADPYRPGGLLGVLEVRDGAVATSGLAERGAHIWDPAAGRPATALAQVTVTGPDLALADGYATAAMALPTAARARDWLDGIAADTGYQALTVDAAGRTTTTASLTNLTWLAPAPQPAAGGSGRG
jgi:thiamine biosynthesis lipoprotein